MSELDSILKQKAATITRSIQSPGQVERQLLVSWKDEKGFAMQMNLTWMLRNTKDVNTVFGIIDECQKELKRRGLNRAA